MTDFSSLVRNVVLAGRNLVRQPRRCALSIGTIGGGVIAFVLAGGFFHWLLDDMRELTIHSQLGHIQITRPDYLSRGLGDPYAHLLPGDVAITADGSTSGPIKSISPRLAFNGLLSKGEQTVAFAAEGVDPTKESSMSRALSIVAGQNLDPSQPESVLLGEGLAANIGAEPGDTVVLLASTASGSMNAVELKVAGLFATITKAYDDTVLRVPIEVARRLVKVDGATTWIVLLQQTEQTAEAQTLLRTRFPASDYDIVPWSELADFYNKTVELFTRQVDVVRLLIGLIIILSISNTLSMTVIERTSEIGTSMAIGVKRYQIMSLFIWEGALLGLAGGTLGVIIGYLLAELISAIGIPMPPAPGMARGYTAQIAVSPGLAVEAVVLAFVTTLIASIVPAWKASRMNIVDALRHQR